jgi:O-methyltransferase
MNANFRAVVNKSMLYDKYRDFTMVGKVKFLESLDLSERIDEIPGSIVEAGVWKGGMLAALAEFHGNSRSYFAYDSFQGLPEAQAIDGESAKRYQSDQAAPSYFDNCAAEEKFIKDLFLKLPGNDLRIIKGWFADTLREADNLPDQIALLRMDGDWYESTMQIMEFLYPRVAKGGVIIIGDYDYWEGCKKAIHTYFNRNSLRVDIARHGLTPFLIKQ